MKAVHRLSALAVRNMTERGFHHDGAGLYLQVSPTGSKSWVLRYTLRGRTRDMGLGSTANLTLAEARETAAQYKKVVKAGHHPIEVREKEQRSIVDAEERFKSFQWCAETHHKELEPEWRNAKHAAQWLNTLRDYAFPKLGKLPVNEIGLVEVKSILEPIWITKAETATRVMQRMRSVITWAAANGRYPNYDASMWEQLRKALPQNKNRRKAKHLESCPYQDAGAALARVKQTAVSDVLKLAFIFTVLTTVRSNEARGAEKREFDLDAGLWRIPADRMKMHIEHVVPLSRQALSIVTQAFALAPDSLLAFPNLKSDQPLSDQAFTKVVLRENLQVDYTTHGFRSTFRTWAAEQTSYPSEVCEAALAHAIKDKVEAAYRRTEFLEKRKPLMQDWADYLDTSAVG